MTGDIIDLADLKAAPEADEDEAQAERALELQSAGLTANPILPAAFITIKTGQKRFETHALSTVHYDRLGLIAKGTWEGEDKEKEVTILFLWDTVAHIEFKFDELRKELTETDSEIVVGDETTSD